MSVDPKKPADGRLGKLVAKGLTAEVFEWPGGRLVKLFFAAVTREDVEREFTVTNGVRAAGVAAPTAHEIVELDGRLGIVFERLEGRTMYREVEARPWKLFWAAHLLGKMHAELHQHRAPDGFPRQRAQIDNWISIAAISEEERAAVKQSYANLPDGECICHGDFHPENIFLTPKGPMIIDWTTATAGSVAADVARTSALFEQAEVPEDTPFFMKLLFELSRNTLHKAYLRSYFQERPELRDEYQAWRKAQLSAGWRWPGARV